MVCFFFLSFELQYADLDEFLSENNIPDGLPGTHLGHSTGLGHRNDSLGHSTGLALGLGHITTKRERSPSPSDCVSPDTINPPSPAESSEFDCETCGSMDRNRLTDVLQYFQHFHLLRPVVILIHVHVLSPMKNWNRSRWLKNRENNLFPMNWRMTNTGQDVERTTLPLNVHVMHAARRRIRLQCAHDILRKRLIDLIYPYNFQNHLMQTQNFI